MDHRKIPVIEIVVPEGWSSEWEGGFGFTPTNPYHYCPKHTEK